MPSVERVAASGMYISWPKLVAKNWGESVGMRVADAGRCELAPHAWGFWHLKLLNLSSSSFASAPDRSLLLLTALRVLGGAGRVTACPFSTGSGVVRFV